MSNGTERQASPTQFKDRAGWYRTLFLYYDQLEFMYLHDRLKTAVLYGSIPTAIGSKDDKSTAVSKTSEHSLDCADNKLNFIKY